MLILAEKCMYGEENGKLFINIRFQVRRPWSDDISHGMGILLIQTFKLVVRSDENMIYVLDVNVGGDIGISIDCICISTAAL